jgi:ornithine cyclodeaminase/alanine dehydrogenase-like protein (mu-crystallin family)
MSSILSMPAAIDVVEAAFIADGRSEIETFSVISHRSMPANGTWIVKSGVIHSDGLETLGLKAGSYWPDIEKSQGISNHNATMMLVDVSNGRVSAILNANLITSLRTAAAGAISSRWLASKRATKIALVGAGDQANAQLEAHLALLQGINEIKVWSRTAAHADDFAARWSSKTLAVKTCTDPRSAVTGVDIVITTTPSREPLLMNGWVKAGAHICAIGSDALGKQELDAELVAACSVFVDKRIQSLTIGEMQQPIARKLVDESHILSELGEVCAGLHPGRRTSEEITLFDSSGVSFQDLAVAEYARGEAERCGLGQRLER